MAKSTFGHLTARPIPGDAKPAGFENPSGDLQIGKVDASGNLLVAVTGAGSGGTSSVDEAAFTAGVSAGTPAMGVYETTPSTLTDGQMGIVALDEDRNVKVNIVAGGGSGGTSSAFGDPFPADGTAIGVADPDGSMGPLSAETFDYDTGAGTVDVTAPGLSVPASGGPLPVLGGHGTAAQALRVELPTDGTGVIATVGAVTDITNPVTVAQGTAGNLNATVVGTGTFAVQVSSSALPSGAATLAEQQTQTTALQIIDDWDESDRAKVNPIVGSAGITGGAGAVDAATTRVAIATDANVVAGGGTAGSAASGVMSVQGIASMTPVQVSQATASSLNAQVVGNVADDSAASGNPVRTGGLAKSPDGSDPGSVAENDVAATATDLNRRTYVNPVHPRFGHKHLNGSTAYTDESIVADPGDGFQVIITNIIASTGAATALNFFLEEGSTTIFGPIYLEAVAGRGFASGPIHLPVTASTAVTLTSSASIAQSFDINYFIQAV